MVSAPKGAAISLLRRMIRAEHADVSWVEAAIQHCGHNNVYRRQQYLHRAGRNAQGGHEAAHHLQGKEYRRPAGAVGQKGQLVAPAGHHGIEQRSEEHTSELQSLMRISYAVFCLKKKKQHKINITN